MSLNDPVADLLTRVRNGQMAKLRYVDALFSKLALNILKVLQEQGFIQSFSSNEEERTIRVDLKYTDSRKPVIQGIKRASTPGVRRYVGSGNIPYVLRGLGISILTTSKGVMTGHQAKKQNIGGEILCYVW